MISSISSSARNVESMVTNLAIGGVLRIKIKKMEIIRNQKDMIIKIKNSKECVTTAVRKGI